MPRGRPPKRKNRNGPGGTRGDQGNTSPGPARKRAPQSTKWCFTAMNTSFDYVALFSKWKEDRRIVRFAVQLEKASTTGKIHLQGAIQCGHRVRPTFFKLPEGTHFEIARDIVSSLAYCSKEDTRVEGPWVKGFYTPYKMPDPARWYRWQTALIAELRKEPDPRKIIWYVDPKGGFGKSFLTKWLVCHLEAMPTAGKATDIMHTVINMCIDKKTGIQVKAPPKIIIADIPRSSLKFVSYAALEKLKDMCFMSGKYEGRVFVGEVPHVVCFANEEPNYDEFSRDRWDVRHLHRHDRDFASPECVDKAGEGREGGCDSPHDSIGADDDDEAPRFFPNSTGGHVGAGSSDEHVAPPQGSVRIAGDGCEDLLSREDVLRMVKNVICQGDQAWLAEVVEDWGHMFSEEEIEGWFRKQAELDSERAKARSRN